MLIKRPPNIAPSEITPREVYLRRREFLAGAASLGLVAGLSAAGSGDAEAAPLKGEPSPLSTTGEALNSLDDITSYNNFYEFGTDKADPKRHAGRLTTRPWKVKIDGLVGKPGDYDATKSRAPRVWALLPSKGDLSAGAEKGDPSLPWVPVNGTVNGRLLASEAAPLLGDAKEAFAAARLELATPAEVSIKLPANASAAWIDGVPVKGGKANVSSGKHVVVVRYQPDGSDFRFEASAGTFLPVW